MASDDYYAILGVAPGAHYAVIQAAYRDLMRRFHPDVNASAEADARAKAINEAYACLRDEERRAGYDWQRRARSGHKRSAYSRAARARSADIESEPARPRPGWNGPSSAGVRSKALLTPSWGKAVGLGIAALITLITFAMTSATPPAGPVVIGRDGEVVMKVLARPGRASF